MSTRAWRMHGACVMHAWCMHGVCGQLACHTHLPRIFDVFIIHPACPLPAFLMLSRSVRPAGTLHVYCYHDASEMHG